MCILQDDKNVAHLTHAREMEKKIESLRRSTSILKDVIQNKVFLIYFLGPLFHIPILSMEVNQIPSLDLLYIANEHHSCS